MLLYMFADVSLSNIRCLKFVRIAHTKQQNFTEIHCSFLKYHSIAIIIIAKLLDQFKSEVVILASDKMDEDFVLLGASFLILALFYVKRRRKNRPRFWVNPYLKGRAFRGRINDVSELRDIEKNYIGILVPL